MPTGVDLARAESAGMAAPAQDRLRLTEARVRAMAAGLRSVAALADPVGEVVEGWVRPNGLRVSGCGCRSAWSA
jgi:glutamate-5-semialdehyde dehydrogenase